MGKEMAVRAYIRVSTEEQALSGYSLRAQEDQLTAIARAHGWAIRRLYRDDGYSAKDLNRPGLQALLQDAEPGEVILVYKLDRLTRSVRDLDDLLRLFDRRGLMFRSATEQFETTTASGRLFLRIITEIAQWERETIAERTAMGKRKKVEMGEWPGGPVPFGFRAVPCDKVKVGKPLSRLVPDPQTAHLVRAIFERYLNGHGLRAVCIWLNDEVGARTSHGARWRVCTLVRLLTNPVYCGDLVYGKRARAGQITQVSGAHEPLVPREIFERVQALFTARKGMAPRQATGNYPLAGIAKCGVCGSRVDGLLHRKRNTYTYRCHNYQNGVGCGRGSMKPLSGSSGRLVEGLLVDAIARLQQPDHLKAFFQQCGEATAESSGLQSAEIDRLRRDLAEAESAMRRWGRGYEAGGLEWEEYLERIRPHKERIKVIEGQLAAQNERPAPPKRAEPATFEMDFLTAWQHLEPPERKILLQRFIGAFVVEILLYPQRRVELRPAQPGSPGLAAAL